MNCIRTQKTYAVLNLGNLTISTSSPVRSSTRLTTGFSLKKWNILSRQLDLTKETNWTHFLRKAKGMGHTIAVKRASSDMSNPKHTAMGICISVMSHWCMV